MVAQESPQVYAVTSRGFMPAVFGRWEGGLEVLRPVNSRREYSFRPEQVLSASDGEAAMRAQRVSQVLADYSIVLVARGTLNHTGAAIRVFRVSHPTDRRRSYMVTTGAISSCTCPGYAKTANCKHIDAVSRFAAPAPAKKRETFSKDEW